MKAETIAHALDLVTAAHKAKLSDTALGVAETIARTEGASRDEVARAIARGLQVVLCCLLLTGCKPASASVTRGSDSVEVVILQPGQNLPGTFIGMHKGRELWRFDQATYVYVERVTP